MPRTRIPHGPVGLELQPLGPSASPAWAELEYSQYPLAGHARVLRVWSAGHGGGTNAEEMSPIFVQWVDALWQAMQR